MMNDESQLASLPLGLLLGRISTAFRQQLVAACGESGGDVRLIGLALALTRNPGGTQADYARYLGIDLNTASRLINRAEEMALIRRVPSQADKRAFSLELAPAGQALAAEGAAAVATIEARLSDRIGAEDYIAFRQLAERVLTALD